MVIFPLKMVIVHSYVSLPEGIKHCFFFFASKKKASNIEIFCLKDWDFSIKRWD